LAIFLVLGALGFLAFDAPDFAFLGALGFLAFGFDAPFLADDDR
jgi:hypothetical protein